MPMKTNLEPAPEKLLSYIRCNCKLSTKNTWWPNMLMRKSGLEMRICLWKLPRMAKIEDLLLLMIN